MASVSIKEFRTLSKYLHKYRFRYLFGFIFLILVDAAQILIPQYVRYAIDLISSGNYSVKAILPFCLAIVGTAAVISFGRFFWRYFIHGSSRRIETEIRDGLFAHLMSLSPSFYQNNKIGDLMARATNDLNAVRMAIGMGLVAFIDGTFMAAAILTIMFIQDAKVSAIAIIPLPFITALIIGFGKAVGHRFKKAQETYASMSDIVQETFAGIRVVKSFVKEDWFIQKFADANDDYRNANMSLVRVYGLFFPLITFLAGLTTLIMLFVGGSRVIEGNMSAGELVAMLSYLQMLIWPMLGAGFTINMMQRGAASLARINEIFATVPDIRSPAFPKTTHKDYAGECCALELRNLSFSYPNGKLALDSISFSIPQGATLGIFGRTGSGKSTLLRLLPRLLDPPPSSIFIDGIDVRDRDLNELRSLFGITPQDTYLFSDSIKNNIAYGATNPTEERLRSVAELSAIAGDLEDFTNGWDTVVGERGFTLSGGQKQRVAISRAIVRDPDILILDDALSAVDAETEERILASLVRDRRDKTTIIVSHRVSTLRYADFVAVLDSGCLKEFGKPEALISSKGYFAETARLQRLESSHSNKGGN
ncbi:ABC transporter ATP-binding protein [Treponema sp.]